MTGETRRIENARNPGKNGGSRTRLHQPASDCTTEGEGFEPSMAFAMPVFKTGAIGHSATPPEHFKRNSNAG